MDNAKEKQIVRVLSLILDILKEQPAMPDRIRWIDEAKAILIELSTPKQPQPNDKYRSMFGDLL